MLNERTSAGNSEVVQAFLANGQGCPTPFRKQLNATVSEMPQQVSLPHDARGAEDQDGNAAQIKMNNFDLNDVYIDSDDGTEDVERSPVPANLGTSSIDCPSWVRQDSQQSSPPQTSGNSDSASAQSPSSSSDAQVYFFLNVPVIYEVLENLTYNICISSTISEPYRSNCV